MITLPKVFFFDDDESNLKLYSKNFEFSFLLKCLQNPHHFKEALQGDTCAILIDLIMPVMGGVELYDVIKADPHYNGCPIIFISGTSSEEGKLNAINIGAQDYLTRTMSKDEMISRITNKIEFFKKNRHLFRLGNVKVNTSELKAYYANEKMELTLTEMRIMKFLMREFPKLSTREEINQEVWPDQKVLPTTLNTHLSNLRNKFPEWEYEIQFIKSKGIELVLKDQAVSL
jgi:DNA-binding response OmpR family regulator